VGPSAGLDAVVKRKILSPCRDSNLRSSSPITNNFVIWLVSNVSGAECYGHTWEEIFVCMESFLEMKLKFLIVVNK